MSSMQLRLGFNMLLSEGQLPLLQNDFWFFKGVSAIQALKSYKM